MIKKYKGKKKFSQNFLVDEYVKDRIVQSCALSLDDVVFEIGPGQGSITDRIAPKVKSVIAIETDDDLIGALEDKFCDSNVKIIHQDVLSFDFSTLPSKIKLISNLPYHIVTAIIEKVIDHKDKFNDIFIMVQQEYANRLVAKPSTKAYGALSCFVQYHCEIEKLFRIGRCSFTPQPKVQSSFLRMSFKNNSEGNKEDEDLLFRITKQAFGQRRKTICNALSCLIHKDHLRKILTDLNIDERKRAENLTLQDYINITQKVSDYQ